MRAPLILVVNLVVGAAILGWVLHRFGGPALALLAASFSPALLCAFVAMVLATILTLSGRWRLLLAGLGPPPSLLPLCLYRSAGHSLAVLVPSGRVGGDPLRAWLAARDRVPASDAIASVAADRTLEIAATVPFSVIFATLLIQQGIPQLERALVTILLGAAGFALGVWMALRRLRSGRGVVTALARRMGLDRLRLVEAQLDVIATSEAAVARLVEGRRLAVAFALGLLANLLVLAEFSLLLAAFDLPSGLVAAVAALFATGASHWLPVPAGLGVLEGAQIWIFGMLGYPAEVGLAVGLAARLRELVWMLPGLLYLLGRSARASVVRLREAS